MVLMAAFVCSAGAVVAKQSGDSVSAPPVAPAENLVWTDKLYYELGETVTVTVSLPLGASGIRYINVMNALDGDYYVFSPYELHMAIPPGSVRVATWDQTVLLPISQADHDAAELNWGISFCSLENGVQVPEGLYMIEWYGAVCYFSIGFDGDVGDLPGDAFAPGAQNALENKFDVVLNLMADGKYTQAINKLTNDVIPYIESRVLDPAVKAVLLDYANDLLWQCQNP